MHLLCKDPIGNSCNKPVRHKQQKLTTMKVKRMETINTTHRISNADAMCGIDVRKKRVCIVDVVVYMLGMYGRLDVIMRRMMFVKLSLANNVYVGM